MLYVRELRRDNGEISIHGPDAAAIYTEIMVQWLVARNINSSATAL